MEVTRERLEAVAPYIDSGCPKVELNYLFIDDKNMVSTNTRALAIVEHYQDDVKMNFYIHKSIIDLSLKQTKAKSFELSLNKIICLDKEGEEILIISRSESTDFARFPAYENIIPKELEKTIPFIQRSHIDGILAVNKVLIDNKYIPKIADIKGNMDFLGYVGINSNNLPIIIFNHRKDMQFIIMPIVDHNLFPEFKE